ncbi:Alpha/Beta hydrolase protein [Immersiella caudata]|uniref:Alpha/Beta hydrolase protein n=1 Tax=Immersiella caudata TaxID=314043 RepID=A0AA39WBB4_9PEZI|nr:Alpha/Beta hydrolase protein [Immersiella caudata]
MAGYCRDCFTGTVETDSTHSGTEREMHGRPTYVSTPSADIEPLGTIVIIPDAFGWTFPNTRSLADSYARRVPCTVLLPDFMNGNALPAHTLTLMDYHPPLTDFFVTRFLKRTWSILKVVPSLVRYLLTCRHALAQPRILSFLRSVRTTQPVPSKLGVVGFCWGGLYAVELTHDAPENKVLVGNEDIDLVDCAFTAHPSLLTIPRDIEKVVKPLSVANGDDDSFMGRNGMTKLKEVLEAENDAAGRDVHEVVIFPGAEHGFGVRRDWIDPLQKECRDKCEDQAVAWFRRQFKTPE